MRDFAQIIAIMRSCSAQDIPRDACPRFVYARAGPFLFQAPFHHFLEFGSIFHLIQERYLEDREKSTFFDFENEPVIEKVRKLIE